MKNLSVRISRINPMENLSFSEIREQISLKQCMVRLQRYNSDFQLNSDVNSYSSVCSEGDGGGGNLVLNRSRITKRKLKRCCIRVERLIYIPISRLSSTD